jgi:hypothetical protein
LKTNAENYICLFINYLNMTRNNTCLLIVILVLQHSSFAQFNKGTRMAGATVGGVFFNTAKYDYSYPSPTNGYTSKTNAFGINLSPNIGWFISNKTVAGGQLTVGYRYDKKLDASGNITFAKDVFNSLTAGAAAFIRHYLITGVKFQPFGQVTAGFAGGSSRNEGFRYYSSYKDSYKGKSSSDITSTAGLSLGATRMLNAHTGLDIYAGYLFEHRKNVFTTNTTRDIDINGSIDETGRLEQTRKATTHNVTFGVGLQVFLDKRK